MHHNIPQSKQQNRRSRRRRRKKMQLFLNFFMLVCILIVIFCIGILKNRENEADAYIENFINRTGYVEDAGGSVQAAVCRRTLVERQRKLTMNWKALEDRQKILTTGRTPILASGI